MENSKKYREFVALPIELKRMLEDEKVRIRKEFGQSLSLADVIRLLISERKTKSSENNPTQTDLPEGVAPAGKLDDKHTYEHALLSDVLNNASPERKSVIVELLHAYASPQAIHDAKRKYAGDS